MQLLIWVWRRRRFWTWSWFRLWTNTNPWGTGK